MATILIVDDHLTNRTFLHTLLGYAGHQVLEAADGAAALRAARSARPDLVIADLVMPTMDGYEFVRQLRADPSIADTRVIFLTATYLERDSYALARACGVEHVLAKPTAPEVILRTVATLLDQEYRPPPSPAGADDGFDREHIRVLTDKLAAKVDELTGTNDRLAALLDLSQRLATERDPAVLLQICCDSARQILGARYAAVDVYHADGRSPRRFCTSGLDAAAVVQLGELPSGHGLLGRLLAEGRPLRTSGLDDPRPDVDLPEGHPALHSFLGAPLASATQRYGALYLANKLAAEEFSDEDEQVLVTLAGLTTIVYENVRRYDDLQHHAAALEQEVAVRQRAEAHLQLSAQRLSTLHQIDQAVLAAQSPEAIAQVALRYVRQLVPCRYASIVAFDLVAGDTALWVFDSDLTQRVPAGAHHSVQETPNLEALRRGEPTVWPDLRAIVQPTPVLQSLIDDGLRSFVSVPIGSSLALIGALNLASDQPESFTPEHVVIAREVSDMLAVAIQNARLFEQVRAGRKRLQLLSGQLVQAQEDERRRIARELHDEIGQSLTAAQLNLQVLIGLPDLSDLPSRLEDSLGLIDRVLQQVRALSLDLRPSLLDDLGLAPALRWLGNRQAERAGFVIQIDAEGAQERYPTDIETTCFRVAQEALTNITRYAQARHVAIVVERLGGILNLAISDDGVGFDLAAAREQAAQGRSLGLLSMQERVGLAGGKITIESAPGRGTAIDVELPIEPAGGRPIERRRTLR